MAAKAVLQALSLHHPSSLPALQAQPAATQRLPVPIGLPAQSAALDAGCSSCEHSGGWGGRRAAAAIARGPHLFQPAVGAARGARWAELFAVRVRAMQGRLQRCTCHVDDSPSNAAGGQPDEGHLVTDECGGLLLCLLCKGVLRFGPRQVTVLRLPTSAVQGSVEVSPGPCRRMARTVCEGGGFEGRCSDCTISAQCATLTPAPPLHQPAGGLHPASDSRGGCGGHLSRQPARRSAAWANWRPACARSAGAAPRRPARAVCGRSASVRPHPAGPQQQRQQRWRVACERQQPSGPLRQAPWCRRASRGGAGSGGAQRLLTAVNAAPAWLGRCV